MSGRSILLLVAVIIAGLTVMVIRGQGQEPEQAPVQAEVRVVLARHDLAPGTFIQGEQDLEFGKIPDKGAVPAPQENVTAVEGENAVATVTSMVAAQEPLLLETSVKLSDFNGAVVRRAIKSGEAVPQSALMRSGEGGFMSAVLEPGMRAVSIAVNATTGNAGFVSPGDRVDLIVTHRFKSGGPNSNEESVVSETFVRDLRIVAVDQMLDNPENKAILAKTVTVECSPRAAEQIAVAGEMGKISLALRSLMPAKKPEEKTDAVVLSGAQETQPDPIKALYGEEASGTRDSDLSRLLEHRALLVPRVQVLRGDKSETIDFQGVQ